LSVLVSQLIRFESSKASPLGLVLGDEKEDKIVDDIPSWI